MPGDVIPLPINLREEISNETWQRLCRQAAHEGITPLALAHRLLDEQAQQLQANIDATRNAGAGGAE